ncbi:putative glutamate carboxypeptidase 2 isoform X1 [Cucumis melo var. makuwa]|uniref:glutamate carboxypeptidase II n=2 Tax=Cucumis melo TaxID=3656 RepID=A0A5D3DNZ1_CUCMM|nr:putative glutamate carboxypeptidase 2 isoform X1 [Cucumis melo var. makuwa]TYK25363.1 putative glutamate carboxypeptidase 2 isoform X1 [Cucumis melo var. makuwa]
MVQPPLKQLATICTSRPAPLPTFFFVIIICVLGFYAFHFSSSSSFSVTSSPRNSVRFQQLLLSSGSNYTVASYLRSLTLHPHLAGTEPSSETVRYVESHFRDLGLETHSIQYDALLSYPKSTSLSVLFSNGSVVNIPLSENVEGVVQPYHAYSPSGTVYGPAVFVNYGRDEDYRELAKMGVTVVGCIAVARKGEFPRGVVVAKAEANGAKGVLLYTEDDRFRQGFERGTVMRGIGDPLSPGWAAVDGAERLNLNDSEVLKRFPKIPSMPLSSESAEIILNSLDTASVPPEWRDKEANLRSAAVGPGGPMFINFTYQGERKVATIRNVIAVIKGLEEPDRFVLMGNHRDAWSFGAVDPNSGTAALLDIARRFALLRKLGWNPRRTILLCSWDAEEFGMIGSTEWVEQNIVNLGTKAVAYLNVDCAVQGPGFFAGATPQLDDLLHDVTAQVQDPDVKGATVHDTWTAENGIGNIERLGAVNSDFAAFVQHAGVPSVDVYYGRDFPVYHTAFDTYDWMANYGDPLFHRHVTVGSIWGLLALRLSDDLILPFSYVSYANQLQAYKDTLNHLLDGSVSLRTLSTSIEELKSAAQEIENEAKRLREQETSSDVALFQKRALNDRLMLAERGFLDVDGLRGRPWFKHLVYGPPSDYESALVYFPGIADAVSESKEMNKMGLEELIQHEIWRVARAIGRAAAALKGELS